MGPVTNNADVSDMTAACWDAFRADREGIGREGMERSETWGRDDEGCRFLYPTARGDGSLEPSSISVDPTRVSTRDSDDKIRTDPRRSVAVAPGAG